QIHRERAGGRGDRQVAEAVVHGGAAARRLQPRGEREAGERRAPRREQLGQRRAGGPGRSQRGGQQRVGGGAAARQGGRPTAGRVARAARRLHVGDQRAGAADLAVELAVRRLGVEGAVDEELGAAER